MEDEAREPEKPQPQEQTEEIASHTRPSSSVSAAAEIIQG